MRMATTATSDIRSGREPYFQAVPHVPWPWLTAENGRIERKGEGMREGRPVLGRKDN